MDDYVLKVLNKDDPNKIDMNEFPSDVNLGQPVWQDENNPRLLILKKIEGNEHSIPNWSKTIWDGDKYAPRPVTKEQARLFHNQLCDLKFPLTWAFTPVFPTSNDDTCSFLVVFIPTSPTSWG